MTFSSVRIVLIATSHPGNIGSTARAMKTMGFHNLYLVSPKSFPDQKAYELAAGADDVLNNAIVTTSLDEALQGCQLVFATSARKRGIPLRELTPSDCAQLITKKSDHTEVAILFGREHSGLTNEELLRGHYHIIIPSCQDYSSLNLSQAVQIIVYELRIKQLYRNTRNDVLFANPLATTEDIQGLYEHLQTVLTAINFLKANKPTKSLLQRIRRIINRAELEHTEIAILRGMLTHVQNALKVSADE